MPEASVDEDDLPTSLGTLCPAYPEDHVGAAGNDSRADGADAAPQVRVSCLLAPTRAISSLRVSGMSWSPSDRPRRCIVLYRFDYLVQPIYHLTLFYIVLIYLLRVDQ